MSRFTWETYRPQPKLFEHIGFFEVLSGYMKAMFQLVICYTRHG